VKIARHTNFNFAHRLVDILPMPNPQGLTRKPREIDLRFFACVRFTDAYNGRDSVIDGLEGTIYLYGSQVVWISWKSYENGRRIGPSRGEGNLLYRKMFDVARAYQDILRIARRKYLHEPLSEEENENPSRADFVLIEDEAFAALKKHPQYKNLIKELGLVDIVRDRDGFVEVNVRKRDREPAA